MNKKQIAYISNYNKKNYKMYQFRIKKSDAKLIEQLDNVSNRNNYLKKLVEKDLSPDVLTLKTIRNKIKPIMMKHGIKNVYLFGSYARGEANNDSDVDIYCDEGDVNTLIKSIAFDEELENALGKKVDVVKIGSDMHEYFRKQLEEDMIKIC